MDCKLPIILASSSPRRHALLQEMGIAYTVFVTDVGETAEGLPAQQVAQLAKRKALAAAQALPEGTKAAVIGADTLVSIDNTALGKPVDRDHARKMISTLSGRTHQVFTGVCIVNTVTKEACTSIDRSDVVFKALSSAQIEEYLESGEWDGKAGAYAIQGLAGALVERYEGSLSNIIGLPVELVGRMLRGLSLIK